MENIEIEGKKMGGESKVNLSVNTIIKIIVTGFLILQFLAGWAYFDLRNDFKNNNSISIEEKQEFLDDIEKEYDNKFEKMFDDISDIKGDIKVILDRQTRDNPILPNTNAIIQPTPPSSLN